MTSQQLQLTFPIADTRPIADFKTRTFSDYKRADVKRVLELSMLREKIEPACHWSAELICSGHLLDLWDTLLFFMSKHIHIGNIRLPKYVLTQFRKFRFIVYKQSFQTDLEARNNEEIRQLFAEMVILFTLSPKRNPYEYIEIDREEEFNVTANREKYKATSTTYAEPVFRKNDPLEVMPAVNEFCRCLTEKHTADACFWLNWIIEFDALCRKRKDPCYVERRDIESIETKWRSDLIWLVWDSLTYYAELIGNGLIRETVNSLYELFCIQYTNAASKKRRFMLYYAISLLTEPITIENAPTIKQMDRIPILVASISEVIYRQIKHKEVVQRPAGLDVHDIMLSNSAKNHQRSIEKMNLFEAMERGSLKE
jgi:hypothetical protein